MNQTLNITINLEGEALTDNPAEEVYRILRDYTGLIGFLGRIEDRNLLDINGNTVGQATITQKEE